MRVLIVDNGSRYTSRIIDLIGSRHDYTVAPYHHRAIKEHGHDMIILSGGMGHEVEDIMPNGRPYYEHQFELVRRAQVPIYGICLGHQIVHAALGGSLKKLDTIVWEDAMPLTLSGEARDLFGKDQIAACQRHHWVVDRPAEGFRIVSESRDGIEITRHNNRPIITTQFHPEHDTSPTSIFWDLVRGLDHNNC